MSIQKILLSFEPSRENVLPLLQEVNRQMGFISKEDTYKIAQYFDIAPAKVYSIVTASGVLRKEKKAGVEIKVCTGGHCRMKERGGLIREIERYLDVEADKSCCGRVRLKTVSCLGLCADGPVMVVNGNIYTKVRAQNIDDILRNYL